jgi:ubiquinone/menaquinone biosynthesis C-methylase UbiE
MQSKDHWEQVYTTKASSGVSWFQEHARQSVQLIQQTGASPDASIIDVGGGASTLVDDLLDGGYRKIAVLDLSEAALAASQSRLGDLATKVSWLVGDITTLELPRHAYDVWHDRAVFHFLTSPQKRKAYVESVLHAVKPGGHVVVATFAEDGPQKCSGLEVMRYNADGLHAEFGAPFIYCLCRKEPN